MTTEPIEGEFTAVGTVKTTTDPVSIHGTALTTTNPFERMALIAMETGKVEQLDKLLDLQLKWEANKAHKAYTGAMAAFKAEPITIVKDKLVEFRTREGDVTSYKHATLAGVVDAVVPAMGRHGLSHRWDMKQEGGQITVTCTITHRDGHAESVSMSAAPDASGKKNSIQQVASTVTYLQRYTLMALCGVAAADMQEDDGRGFSSTEVTYITVEQLNVLTELVAAWITNQPKFLQWISAQAGFEVTTLGEVPASLYDAVVAQVNAIRKEKEGRNG